MLNPPTFVVAGGQRCGTTWLYHLLDAHPEIFMAKPTRPEPKFFLSEPTADRDIGWYRRTWFADTGDAKAVGEKSTSYLETPGTAERIHRVMPQLQVLVILRHPIERAISNFAFSTRHGLETADPDFALRNEEQRLRETNFEDVSVHPLAYAHRSRYVDHLREFAQHLPSEQLGVFLYDDLQNEPENTCAGIYDFLAVDTGFVPENFAKRYNESPLVDATVAPETVEFLLEQFRRPNRELESLIGRDLSHWDTITPAIERVLNA